jgi:hypothetical protein
LAEPLGGFGLDSFIVGIADIAETFGREHSASLVFASTHVARRRGVAGAVPAPG